MAPNNTGALEAPLLAEEGGSAAGSDAGSSAGGSGGKGKGPPMNRNVLLTIVLAALSGLADSLWSNTVLSAYLFLLCKDRNAPVGQAEAVSGLSTLFTALPVGYLADKYSRSGVIAFGGASYLPVFGLSEGHSRARQHHYSPHAVNRGKVPKVPLSHLAPASSDP